MKAQILCQFTLLPLTCIALVIFLGVFVGMLMWVFRKSSRTFYSDMAQMPLNEV